MFKHVSLIVILLLLSGCQKPHLEIFPALEDPSLVDELLTVTQMSEDIDAFIYGTLERHPNMSTYADVDNLFYQAEQLKKQLKKPLKRVDFFKIIGQLNAELKDGHSFLIWPYQEYAELKSSNNKPFPFAVKLTSNKQLVLANTYKSEGVVLKAGKVIQTINSVSAGSLIDEMQQYVGGETRRLREQIVAERFPIMLWAVTGAINDFDLLIDGQRYQVTRDQQWSLEEPHKEELHYRKLNKGTGLLYIGHFDIEPTIFEEVIDRTFEKISKDGINNLIIDVRDNPGGNTDTVTYLTSYLANESFRLVSSLQEKLNEDNRGIFNYKGEIGEVTSQQWNEWESPNRSDNLFNGNTYVLIGPITYSAAIVFATSVQDNQLGTLVGEPTGGYASQSAQGNLFNLPNSKLRAYITTRLLVRPSGDDSQAPVVPEYIVSQTADALLADRDLAIEKVVELINSKQ